MPLPDDPQVPQFLIDLKNIVLGAMGNLLWFLAGLLVIWSRRNVNLYLIFKRMVIVFFSRKKYILIWNDDDNESLGERMITSLHDLTPPASRRKFRYKVITRPEQLVYFPSGFRYVHLILLVVTDVTKLADNEKKRIAIQKKLKNYTDKGGILIGTHDLIYRRCRNTVLQNEFGCMIEYFERHPDPITVTIRQKYRQHPLLKDLPDQYDLNDGEVTTGTWRPEVHVLAATRDKFFNNSHNPRHVPTICLKTTPFDGVIIWLSSGDKVRDHENAASLDQPEFTRIVYNAVAHAKEIKTFVYQ